jgi:predicted transcriptional regulator YdeE
MEEKMYSEIKTCIKSAFSVIGKEGSTVEGNDFIKKLWENANNHFGEVEALAKKDDKGNIVGVWGLMSDLSRSFKPWEENFTKGLYLAGVEVRDDVETPKNWIKWTVPATEYLYIKVDNEYKKTFDCVLNYMNAKDIKLAGAVFDYNCPEENGQLYLFFPIKRL